MKTPFFKFKLATLLLFLTMQLPLVVQGKHSNPLESKTSGSCCLLPSSTSGPLSILIGTSNTFINAANRCYAESLADFGSTCGWWPSVNPIFTTISIGIPFSQIWANDVADHCSYMEQIANAALSTRPGRQWLMSEIVSISHLSGTNFHVQAKWQKYICQAPVKLGR